MKSATSGLYKYPMPLTGSGVSDSRVRETRQRFTGWQAMMMTVRENTLETWSGSGRKTTMTDNLYIGCASGRAGRRFMSGMTLSSLQTRFLLV
ncbi:hypothetical protein [Izhakiella capsodis]|uniref:hypothetical protein n=1 Tax=Izhakiella capsodis TaxID=1367852 RepID=UPI0015A63E8B|nr:hypothetical protein [Izhakiella capsodis]